ncbi:MAG: cytochrome c oxidase assembly factor Coa1 family protein [Methylobacter sp.]|nr:cytochrome c oxidase assembly factor Coa1 family protein [Methylobacter sp.]
MTKINSSSKESFTAQEINFRSPIPQEGIMENTSGQGKKAIVPAEIDNWNWGAFLLNWIWGIGNNTFIALLMFVPFVNFVIPFVLGVKGSAWAWRNKEWESIDHFKAVQKKWARWTVIVYLGFIVLFAGLFFITMSSIKDSDVFKLAESQFESSRQASDLIGLPFFTGLPSGSIEISEPSGKATVSFSVEGSKGKGTVYFDAVKELGQWQINSLVLEEEISGKRIDIDQHTTSAPTEEAVAPTSPVSVEKTDTPSETVVIAAVAKVGTVQAKAGVRKPTGDVNEFWDNFSWDELSADEKKLWAVLGWNGRVWGSETESPASDGTSWDKLSKEEQAALTSLGYVKKSWNKE